ncbi:MAG: chromosome segregation protein SMC [Planctomycetota bacterium]|nr:MAG: chromosome segregation protein SMC [Planctomycetota bacterium]
MTDSTFIERVALRNYKSIGACDVRLGNLTFLVGPNGSGKSNFLDALEFLADATRNSLDHALRGRGGINEVRRRSKGHPTHFGIRVEFRIPNIAVGHYAFLLGAKKDAYIVQREELAFSELTAQGTIYHRYLVENGEVVECTTPAPPAASRDRLYLVNISGLPQYRPIYDAFSRMGFYNLNPDEMRDLQPPDPGDLLKSDGSNLPSALAALARRNPRAKQRVCEYLSSVVPGISDFSTITQGNKETIEFRQLVAGAPQPWRFTASSMSDGTLRALGILTALFQNTRPGSNPAHLVGIEEPETALHPAAAGVLIDSFEEACEHVQLIVTSHSPELLDNEAIGNDNLLAVVSDDGNTHIGPIDNAGRSALRDHLYTAGELLRMDQLRPDPQSRVTPEQLDLFRKLHADR